MDAIYSILYSISFGEKMASSLKRPRPRRIRHRIETECETEAEKDALAGRLHRMRELLSSDGSGLIDNGSLLNAMFDIVERVVTEQATAAAPATLSPSMMRNSGKTLPCSSFLVIRVMLDCDSIHNMATSDSPRHVHRRRQWGR